MKDNPPKIIKFEDIRDELLKELSNKSTSGRLKVMEKVTLVDGFINQLTTQELSNTFVLGGPTIPMIMLIGNESGQLYFFALKALLPKIFE